MNGKCRQLVKKKEMKKLTINQWAIEDRPREKMMLKGAEALSDAELLAILIDAADTCLLQQRPEPVREMGSARFLPFQRAWTRQKHNHHGSP